VSAVDAPRPLVTTLRIVLAIVGVIVFGAGIPLLWIWVGSQLQGGTAPSLAGLGVALLGIVVSYALLLTAFAWLRERLSPSEGPVRHEWNRSLSAERKQGPETSSIEDIAAAATIVVAIICTVWFLLFGDPGVPAAP
jgi:Na+/melibiose symporter-like transporter